MEISLEQILKPADSNTLRYVIEDALELKERAQKIEKEAYERYGINLTLPEAANIIGSMRWPHHTNIFVHTPDLKVCNMFYKHGLYERSKDELPSLQPGMNNQYMSWPLGLAFYAAYHTHSKHWKTDSHLRLIETALKFCPSVRLDIRNSSFISKICSYGGVDHRQRSRFTRGLMYSVPGELLQNSLGVSEEPEIRGAVVGLLVLDDLLKYGGTEKLEATKISDFFDMSIRKLDNMGQSLKNNPELIEYFDHFNTQEQKWLSRYVRKGLSKYMQAAEEQPLWRKLPGLGYFYRHCRPSMKKGGYKEISFGKFPEPILSPA